MRCVLFGKKWLLPEMWVCQCMSILGVKLSCLWLSWFKVWRKANFPPIKRVLRLMNAGISCSLCGEGEGGEVTGRGIAGTVESQIEIEKSEWRKRKTERLQRLVRRYVPVLLNMLHDCWLRPWNQTKLEGFPMQWLCQSKWRVVVKGVGTGIWKRTVDVTKHLVGFCRLCKQEGPRLWNQDTRA